MENIKYPENFEKLYEELKEWMYANDYDGGLEYAFNNDYQLHAVSCWESSGASKYNFSAGINKKAELKEIESLLNSADVFICKECDHQGFYEKGELTAPPECMGCGRNAMYLDKKGE